MKLHVEICISVRTSSGVDHYENVMALMQTCNISADALPWAVTFPAKAIEAWLLLSGWDTRRPEPNELLCFFIKGLSEDDISHWDQETILPGVCNFQIEEKTCIKGMGCDWFSCSQLEVLCQTATVRYQNRAQQTVKVPGSLAMMAGRHRAKHKGHRGRDRKCEAQGN